MGEKNIRLDKKISKNNVLDILNEFKSSMGKFEIYDNFYPSPSDPGAYICYSNYDEVSDSFSMTLGNLGWSGGIYQIKTEVVIEQLLHLAHTQDDFLLDIENATFFSHYEKEPQEKSNEMNSKIHEIHKHSNA